MKKTERKIRGGGEMGDPRPDKVAVVEEVKQKLADADGVLLTEYRGLNVKALADLRRALRDAGGEYKIYKNTLVRLAAQDAGLEIDDLLTGPTAIAFVGVRADGSAGDVAAVAKALKDFAKTNDSLVIKGGVLDNQLLSADDLKALAELPSRDVLLAQLAGAFQAPMAKFAGLLAAVPRDFAYGLQALIEKGGGPNAAADAPAENAAADAPAENAAADASGDESGEAPEAEATAVEATEEVVADEATEATETEASADADTGDASDNEAGDAGDDSGDAGEEQEA
ncbi:MAG: large subunit ribosomal protein L10 [Candidatus Aldehydirespiratoraceae bacterium]|jgi:large subunit ribosomal protein L10